MFCSIARINQDRSTSGDSDPPRQPPIVSKRTGYTTPGKNHQVGGSSSSSKSFNQTYWGTQEMGIPAVPTCHPDNKMAALCGATDDQAAHHHHPYLQYNPRDSPMEPILYILNSWAKGTETLAKSIWQDFNTSSSVLEAVWENTNLTAKATTRRGFEALYKQAFATKPNEKLKMTLACYLSTSTGPVSGTIYLSNDHAAFCSDLPLCFAAPSGQETWSHYKIMVPLREICAINNPVVMRDNPSEKYIQIVTLDGREFWFMGFVNYESASHHISYV